MSDARAYTLAFVGFFVAFLCLGMVVTGGQTDITPARVVNARTTVTVDGATTFALSGSRYVALACTGAETINTITGGVEGWILTIEHTDTDCTIADDDAATAADAVDLTGTATNDVGATAKIVQLLYNGTHWYQVAESDN